MVFHGHVVIVLSVVYGKICSAKAENDITLQCKITYNVFVYCESLSRDGKRSVKLITVLTENRRANLSWWHKKYNDMFKYTIILLAL